MAGRVRRQREQAALVVEASPDVVCLQEVSARTHELWARALRPAGWEHVAVAEPGGPGEPLGRRPLSVLTAARTPLQVLDIPGLPWTERALSVVVTGIEVVNVHSPISPSPGLAKVLTHEALHEHLVTRSGPRLVCGDLNTPRKEHPDGNVWTFARTRYGKLRPERGERWDRAELALIKGLEAHGFFDAFRARHGLEVRELSWKWQRWGGGYRLDHLIVSAELEAREVSYLHAWRDEGLSDHSALLAEVTVRGKA